jgi:uncharacterized protein YceK
LYYAIDAIIDAIDTPLIRHYAAIIDTLLMPFDITPYYAIS